MIIKGKFHRRKGWRQKNYDPEIIKEVKEKLTPMPKSPYPHIPNPAGWWPLAKKKNNPYA